MAHYWQYIWKLRRVSQVDIVFTAAWGEITLTGRFSAQILSIKQAQQSWAVVAAHWPSLVPGSTNFRDQVLKIIPSLRQIDSDV